MKSVLLWDCTLVTSSREEKRSYPGSSDAMILSKNFLYLFTHICV